MSLEIGQVLTQIVAFLIVVWVLKKFAWKPLLSVMEERRKKIRAEFEGIEEQKKKVQTLTEEYQEKLKGIEAEARAKIQEAVNEGRKISQEIQTEARAQAREILDRTKEQVEREIAKAKIQLKNDLVNMTVAATEKIIKEKLDAQKHQKLIEEFIDQAEFK